MFHLLQENLLLAPTGYSNEHLENFKARIYLKMEWNALEKAILSTDNERNEAIKAAIAFRSYRRELFTEATKNENLFENHEGIAEYNGRLVYYGKGEELLNYIWEVKNKILNMSNFSKIFGYYSGLLYGFLLDESSLNWRKEIKKNNDLGDLLLNVYNLKFNFFDVSLKKKLLKEYKFEQLKESEKILIESFEENKKFIETLFSKNTTLKIPLISPSISCNQNASVLLNNNCYYYPYINITDIWGMLVIKNGGCYISEYQKFVVFLSESFSCENGIFCSQNWQLEIFEDWEIIPNDTNFEVAQKII